VSVDVPAAEWEVRARLDGWREREQHRVLGVNRDLGETTVEMLHDQAVQATVERALASAGELSDRQLRDWLREALRVRVKNHRLTLGSQATVDAYEAASRRAAANGSDALRRVVMLEATRMTLEFEATLSERERQLEGLQRADVPVAQIRRRLGLSRAEVRSLQYAVGAKRELFDRDLATGDLCAVRQRFIALAASGRAGVRMRTVVRLHVAWCPRCRPVLALSMREAARRALGVFAPVPAVLERVWRRAGALLRPAGGSRAGELVAGRLPETLGSAAGSCATAGACVLLAGGAVVGVRAVDQASTPARHGEHRHARAQRRIVHSAIALRPARVSPAASVKALTTLPATGRATGSATTGATAPASTSVATRQAAPRRAAGRAAARRRVVAAQTARATGQFGQPGVVEGGSPTPARAVSAVAASASGSSVSRASSTGSSSSSSSSTGSGSGGSTGSSTSSSGHPAQFFAP